jgi:hypothetical protein
MSQILPDRWNIFQSEREFDPEFFSGSPFHSKSFILVTVLLCVDLSLGALIGIAFWSLMPTLMKGLIILVMLGLPNVWIRMRRDHRKMAAWYAAAPREEINTYPVRMAAHLMTFAPYQLYLLVLILMMCLAAVLRHQVMLLSS